MAKSHIFSGKEPSRAEKAANRLQLAEMDARRVGIDPGANPRTIAEKEAKAEQLEQKVKEIEQKRKEEERKQREAEERRKEFQRRKPIREALESGNFGEVAGALVRVLTSDEQEELQEYDSKEIMAIAEIYANSIMPLSEAIAAYEAQRAAAEAEMARGEYDVNWQEEEPF